MRLVMNEALPPAGFFFHLTYSLRILARNAGGL